jgi:hypothetical protein
MKAYELSGVRGDRGGMLGGEGGGGDRIQSQP